MMFVPLFQLCSTDPGVTALLGSGVDCRLYPFGEVPEPPVLPYAVWQRVTGLPESYLGDRPDAESHSIQIDVYANTATASREVGAAIEYAIETHAYVSSYRPEQRDLDTKLYRTSFDVDWILNR